MSLMRASSHPCAPDAPAPDAPAPDTPSPIDPRSPIPVSRDVCAQRREPKEPQRRLWSYLPEAPFPPSRLLGAAPERVQRALVRSVPARAPLPRAYALPPADSRSLLSESDVRPAARSPGPESEPVFPSPRYLRASSIRFFCRKRPLPPNAPELFRQSRRSARELLSRAD